jgi:uncharacterized surface protein with fasciclin (FAS1) repeats
MKVGRVKTKQGWLRLSIALSLAGWVAVQIPVPGNGAGLAADCYNCSGGGREGRPIIMTSNALMVGYGLYSSIKTATSAPVPSVSPAPTMVPPPADTKPIYDAARENEDLTGIADLADAAGLKDPLRNDGPYTAFLPTNNALAQLDSARRTELMQPQNRAQLETVVRSHIVKGQYTIERLKVDAARAGQEGVMLDTLSGEKIRITYDAQNGLRINGISVAETDILCSNGVIHPISTMIVPASGGENDER